MTLVIDVLEYGSLLAVFLGTLVYFLRGPEGLGFGAALFTSIIATGVAFVALIFLVAIIAGVANSDSSSGVRDDPDCASGRWGVEAC